MIYYIILYIILVQKF